MSLAKTSTPAAAPSTRVTGGSSNDEPTFSVQLCKDAKAGDPIAQNNLGLCYRYGFGIKVDTTAAVAWYEKAVEKKYAVAQYNLATCLEDGVGTAPNAVRAVGLYQAAADQNNADAQTQLGRCHEDGIGGLQKNDQQAVAWYKKAAEQDHPSSLFRLGNCYRHGRGVEKSPTRAVDLYRRAIEQGSINAKYFLATCYQDGVGVSQDMPTAIKLFEEAAAGGIAPAQRRLDRLRQVKTSTTSAAIPASQPAKNVGSNELEKLGKAANAEFAAGKYQEAAKLFDELLPKISTNKESKPDFAVASYSLGRSLFELAKIEEAKSDPRRDVCIAQYQEAKKHFEDAQKLRNEKLSNLPGNKDSLEKLARELKKCDDKLKALQKTKDDKKDEKKATAADVPFIVVTVQSDAQPVVAMPVIAVPATTGTALGQPLSSPTASFVQLPVTPSLIVPPSAAPAAHAVAVDDARKATTATAANSAASAPAAQASPHLASATVSAPPIPALLSTQQVISDRSLAIFRSLSDAQIIDGLSEDSPAASQAYSSGNYEKAVGDFLAVQECNLFLHRHRDSAKLTYVTGFAKATYFLGMSLFKLAESEEKKSAVVNCKKHYEDAKRELEEVKKIGLDHFDQNERKTLTESLETCTKKLEELEKKTLLLSAAPVSSEPAQINAGKRDDKKDEKKTVASAGLPFATVVTVQSSAQSAAATITAATSDVSTPALTTAKKDVPESIPSQKEKRDQLKQQQLADAIALLLAKKQTAVSNAPNRGAIVDSINLHSLAASDPDLAARPSAAPAPFEPAPTDVGKKDSQAENKSEPVSELQARFSALDDEYKKAVLTYASAGSFKSEAADQSGALLCQRLSAELAGVNLDRGAKILFKEGENFAKDSVERQARFIAAVLCSRGRQLANVLTRITNSGVPSSMPAPVAAAVSPAVSATSNATKTSKSLAKKQRRAAARELAAIQSKLVDPSTNPATSVASVISSEQRSTNGWEAVAERKRLENEKAKVEPREAQRKRDKAKAAEEKRLAAEKAEMERRVAEAAAKAEAERLQKEAKAAEEKRRKEIADQKRKTKQKQRAEQRAREKAERQAVAVTRPPAHPSSAPASVAVAPTIPATPAVTELSHIAVDLKQVGEIDNALEKAGRLVREDFRKNLAEALSLYKETSDRCVKLLPYAQGLNLLHIQWRLTTYHHDMGAIKKELEEKDQALDYYRDAKKFLQLVEAASLTDRRRVVGDNLFAEVSATVNQPYQDNVSAPTQLPPPAQPMVADVPATLLADNISFGYVPPPVAAGPIPVAAPVSAPVMLKEHDCLYDSSEDETEKKQKQPERGMLRLSPRAMQEARETVLRHTEQAASPSATGIDGTSSTTLASSEKSVTASVVSSADHLPSGIAEEDWFWGAPPSTRPAAESAVVKATASTAPLRSLRGAQPPVQKTAKMSWADMAEEEEAKEREEQERAEEEKRKIEQAEAKRLQTSISKKNIQAYTDDYDDDDAWSPRAAQSKKDETTADTAKFVVPRDHYSRSETSTAAVAADPTTSSSVTVDKKERRNHREFTTDLGVERRVDPVAATTVEEETPRSESKSWRAVGSRGVVSMTEIMRRQDRSLQEKERRAAERAAAAKAAQDARNTEAEARAQMAAAAKRAGAERRADVRANARAAQAATEAKREKLQATVAANFGSGRPAPSKTSSAPVATAANAGPMLSAPVPTTLAVDIKVDENDPTARLQSNLAGLRRMSAGAKKQDKIFTRIDDCNDLLAKQTPENTLNTLDMIESNISAIAYLANTSTLKSFVDQLKQDCRDIRNAHAATTDENSRPTTPINSSPRAVR
jgi:TPR repeat protein